MRSPIGGEGSDASATAPGGVTATPAFLDTLTPAPRGVGGRAAVLGEPPVDDHRPQNATHVRVVGPRRVEGAPQQVEARLVAADGADHAADPRSRERVG